MEAAPPPAADSRAACGEAWPWLLVFPCVFLMLPVQQIFLNCACSHGRPQLSATGILDTLVLLRCVAAPLLGERNHHWIIYIALVSTSIFWIPLLSTVAPRG